ncbi:MULTISPECIES: hypothetical protein [Sphingomonadales]|jgi:hypothetical protein|uniref:hypothetical protein n=1 Tax=Sphingomonadales TaxID=204457 RepID=UPI00082FBDA9|nr:MULTISPECIES: hypothetical protein [Sphingomonadales]
MTAITIAPRDIELQAGSLDSLYFRIECLRALFDQAQESAAAMVDMDEGDRHNAAERIRGICEAGDQLVDHYSTCLAEIRDELKAVAGGKANG